MKTTFTRLRRAGGAALLATLLLGCARSPQEDPAPRVASADAQGDLTYYQYPNLPEAMSEVMAASRGLPNVYALSRSTKPGGHTIYNFVPADPNQPRSATAGSWRAIPGPSGGGAAKLAVGVGQFGLVYLYAVTDSHELWISPGPDGANWRSLGVFATDVAVSDIYSGQPTIYCLGAANVTGGHPIYRLEGSPLTPREFLPGSAAVSLSCDYYGRLWVVNSFNQIFVGPSLTGSHAGDSFTLVPGAATHVAASGGIVGVTGTRFLDHGYEIFTRSVDAPANAGWRLYGGDATQIGSNTAGDFFLANDLGELFFAQYQY